MKGNSGHSVNDCNKIFLIYTYVLIFFGFATFFFIFLFTPPANTVSEFTTSVVIAYIISNIILIIFIFVSRNLNPSSMGNVGKSFVLLMPIVLLIILTLDIEIYDSLGFRFLYVRIPTLFIINFGPFIYMKINPNFLDVNSGEKISKNA